MSLSLISMTSVIARAALAATRVLPKSHESSKAAARLLGFSAAEVAAQYLVLKAG